MTIEEEHEKQMYLDGLWDEFFINRHPSLLASFVRQGGDIDDQETRNLIADLLETVTHKHSRAQSQSQVDFYMAVKEVMREHNLSSRDAAFRQMTGKKKGDNLKTEQARYAAGAKLIGDRKTPKV